MPAPARTGIPTVVIALVSGHFPRSTATYTRAAPGRNWFIQQAHENENTLNQPMLMCVSKNW